MILIKIFAINLLIYLLTSYKATSVSVQNHILHALLSDCRPKYWVMNFDHEVHDANLLPNYKLPD